MDFSGPSLRDRFRTGTRAAQDALERAHRQYDLTDPAQYTRFLLAQAEGLHTLQRAAPEMAQALTPPMERLTADLDTLGQTAATGQYRPPAGDDAQARGYIWHNQQLTLRMLTRDLPDDGRPRAYLSGPRDTGAWRALCETLEQLPGYGAGTDAALAAANDWLALFETIHLTHART